MSYTDKQINQMFDYLKLSNDVFKLNQRLSEHRRLYLNQPQDNHDDNNNDQDSENSSKHTNNDLPNTDEELTFKLRKVGAESTKFEVSIAPPGSILDEDKQPVSVVMQHDRRVGVGLTEQEARDLANALYSASNYLRSQK